jgi:hypothetical protein
MGPGRPKNKITRNGFKADVCVGLINMNPTKLEWDQIDIVCSIYRGLFISSNG